MTDFKSSIHRHEAIPGLRHVFSSAESFPGGVLLLTGPAGSGKTMYCMQFLREGASDGEQCFYVSLDPLFTEERFKKAFQGEQIKFVHAFKKGTHETASMIEQIRASMQGAAAPRVAVDSITHLLPHFSEEQVIEFASGLFDVLTGAGAAGLVTLTTMPSSGLPDTLASLADGTLQLKIEDEGNELVRSIRLLSVRNTYHHPVWARFRIRHDGKLSVGHDPAEAEITCKLCDKPIAGKVAFDSESPFHPHCLETYRKLSDIYGSSIITVLPAGVVNANFFFIDIVGLSDPSLSVEKQIKKIESLNRFISACDAVARTPKDKRIILPTGDGMAIGFLVNPELPLQLSMQLHRKLDAFNRNASGDDKIGVRIGLSAGPVFVVSDVNNNQNVWGPGIIAARRVMDIGDDRHILISGNLAEELVDLKDEYRSAIKLVSADFKIKHGQAIKVYSAFSRDYGNPQPPTKLV